MVMKYILLYACAVAVGLGSAACDSAHRAPISVAPAPVIQQNPTPTPPALTSPLPVKYPASDCHLHLVDFLQRTDGIDAAVAAMDACGVQDALVHGMPVVKAWPDYERIRPEYYLEDDSRCYWYSATDVAVARMVMSLPPDKQKRFHPSICGFNGADRNAVDHIKRMIDWYPGFWQAIGEVMTRHDDLTALTYGEVAKADNKALDAVFTFAGQHDLPVFLHSNIGSVWKRDPIYMPEVEEAVKNHPQTRFVWCHAGISRRIDIPTLTTVLPDLLQKYPNLHVDISWVVFETYLYKDGKPSQDWVNLIEQFPDRFLVGSDKVGHFSDYFKEIQKYYPFLDALKPDTAKKLMRDNFLAILPKQGATLTEEETAAIRGSSMKPGTVLLK
jgi:hypothetical protein